MSSPGPSCMEILPAALMAWSATMDTGVESALLAMNWATERSISFSSARSLDWVGQSFTSPTWFICSTCSSLVPRWTPWSMRNRKRLAMDCPSRDTQPVSMRPARASTRPTGISEADRKLRTCGHTWPGAVLTSAQLSSPSFWIRTCSSWAPATRGAGRGTSNSPASNRLSVIGGIG